MRDQVQVLPSNVPLQHSLADAPRLQWFPVVLTFSFTSKELQTQPLTTLQDRFEQLDIKLLTEYHAQHTTHVVSKKRNTAKGLQALINGKYIVTESFLDAVVQAAASQDSEDGTTTSLLEQDFGQHWPNAMDHLPPRGGEPVQHPDETYAPDLGRRAIFEGYTFIFYDESQFNNLLAAITNGGGKGVLEKAIPEMTEVDDFIRAVKSVAGEKGLGSFNDGSEGKGVVLVRYVPAKGPQVAWYAEFFTAVSLRLDHRPIEQSEFLEAILTKDASILRRPLEIESSPIAPDSQTVARQETSQPAEDVNAGARPAALRRPAGRRTVKRRFAGFDDGADIDMDDAPSGPQPRSGDRGGDEEGLFVPHDGSQDAQEAQSLSRKRPGSPLPEDELMDGVAPAVARFKKQKLERGEAFASPSPDPEPEAEPPEPEPKKKARKEVDILAAAAENRAQEEERARREREDLANLPDDVDLAEIRKLNIVEEMEIRRPAGTTRTREQDVAEGRWDPKWNGMKNFKKFRQRGEIQGWQPARSIIPLTEVKNKEFGVGDDYWLEDDTCQRRKKATSQPSTAESRMSPPAAQTPPRARAATVRGSRTIDSDSDEEDGEQSTTSVAVADSSRTQSLGGRATRAQASTPSSTPTTGPTIQGKRRPVGDAPGGEATKRQRPPRKVVEIPASDDSDDELNFRFGKRR